MTIQEFQQTLQKNTSLASLWATLVEAAFLLAQMEDVISRKLIVENTAPSEEEMMSHQVLVKSFAVARSALDVACKQKSIEMPSISADAIVQLLRIPPGS
jgi:hypothetical protein